MVYILEYVSVSRKYQMQLYTFNYCDREICRYMKFIHCVGCLGVLYPLRNTQHTLYTFYVHSTRDDKCV